MKLKAKITIYAGKEVFAPGDVLVIKDRKEAQSLIDRGFAERVEDQPLQQEAAPRLPQSVPSQARGVRTQPPAPLPFTDATSKASSETVAVSEQPPAPLPFSEATGGTEKLAGANE